MKTATISGSQAASPNTPSEPPRTKTNSSQENDTSKYPTHDTASTARPTANAVLPGHGNDSSNGNPQTAFDHIPPTDASLPGLDPLLNRTELAGHYRVSIRTIDRWVAAGLPRHYIGKRQTRFRLSEMQLWLQQNHNRRFASQGIATTMTEVRRRTFSIPVLNGLQILQSDGPPKQSPQPKKRAAQ
jgi:hypothetical protein